MISKILTLVKNPAKIYKHFLFRVAKISPFKFLISDHSFDKIKYSIITGSQYDQKNVHTFYEKIIYLKKNYIDEKLNDYVDKLRVREIVRNKIGEKYLNNVIKTFDSFNEINLEDLPISFALKSNHGSGFNIIVKDKTAIDWSKAIKQFKKWLKIDYYYASRERQYKGIKPQIYIEEYLVGTNDILDDYKFLCFDGKVHYFYISRKKYDAKGSFIRERIFYTREFRKITWNDKELFVSDNNSSKPNFVDEMIQISEILSKGFKFVRIDLYYVNDKIKFSEYTFTPSDGMFFSESKAADRFFGDKIKL